MSTELLTASFTLAILAFFLVQALFIEMAYRYGSPRGYWIMSWIVGGPVAWIVYITAPQVISI